MTALSKLILTVKGGPPKDGGIGSGNWKRDDTYYPRNSEGYLDFMPEGDAPHSMPGKYFDETMQPWYEGLTDQQRAAVNSYSGSGSDDMNYSLRFGKLRPRNDQFDQFELEHRTQMAREYTKNLYAAMKPSLDDMVVYRGTSFNPATLKTGYTFRDRGFISTTLSPGQAHNYSFMQAIKIPAGTPVAYGNFDDRKEYEVILPPNTSFKVAGPKDKHRGYGPVQQLEIVKTKKSYPTLVKRVQDVTR